ncbi:MAG: FG-GAP repeat protein [Myxococcota bacterium]|nr:FG-GAP repeat protein [Myxococcota bacterium]
MSCLTQTGCPVDCEGIGCADLFTATRISVFPGEGSPTSNPSAESASLLLEGDASRGPQFSLIIAEQTLIAGTPYSGDVLLLDPSSTPAAMDLEQRVLSRVEPEGVADAHGAEIVSVPDMDGDGQAELAIGAPDSRGGGTDLEAGAAYLHLSLMTGWSEDIRAQDARLRVLGESARDHLGARMVGCSDIDGDALGDLVIAAPHASGGATLGGEVHMVLSTQLGSLEPQVLSGSLNQTWVGVETGGLYGNALSCISGFQSPTTPGLAIGAPGAPGSAGQAGAGSIYLVAADPLPPSGDATTVSRLILQGENTADALGHSLDAGDIDGDGLSELLAGAPGSSFGAGAVHLWTGEQLADEIESPALIEFTAETDRDHLGRAVALADFNGDGHLDILIGAPRFAADPSEQDEFHGVLYMFLGSADIAGTWSITQPVLESDVRWYSPEPFLRTGESFVTGDLNADGYAEIALLLGARP